MRKDEVLSRLGWQDAFADFVPHAAPETWSWHFDHAFIDKLYRRIPQPQVVAEVGSWLGNSAIKATTFYASQLKWRDMTLFCIDTWLGSCEHWLPQGADVGKNFPRTNGYPVIYEQFLSNIVYSGMQEQIVPLPQTSINAARIIGYYQQAEKLPLFDWIYIDASHFTVDVMMDIHTYWNLLKPGGLLFGDDWSWGTVAAGVKDFADMHGLTIEASYYTWTIWKPETGK